jgi:AraC-like DNA-binding protein
VEIAPPYQLMGTLGRSPDYEAITFACGPALLRQTLASGVGLAALPCFALDARPYIQVPPAQFEPLQHLALAIEAEWEGQATHWQDVIRSYLHALILQVSRHYAEQVTQLRRSPASRYALAARFQAVVEQRFVEILDGGTPDLTLISSYAQELGIDESYLGETIRHVFGRSPSELIRERLLLEARYLVRYSTLTISEIADRLGFRDVSYFSRWFKQRTGVAPVHYRG